jgi:UDP-N-acetylglucosamine acyltransferase
MGGLPLAEAREQLLAQAETSEDVRQMLEFLDRSERSLAR